jgi:hypothetical protein
MAPLLCVLWLCLSLASTAAAIGAHERHVCSPSRVPAIARASCLARLRGGADDDDDLEEDLPDVQGDVDDVVAAGAETDDAVENPFLGMPGAGAGGGLGLQDLQSTLNDPKMLQDALKELQDPAVQQQVKAMMEDPAFQQSMKQYMEQITKDPAFEALKEQTEQMLQQEGFMEQMSKAFAEMGSALGQPSDAESDDESK